MVKFPVSHGRQQPALQWALNS